MYNTLFFGNTDDFLTVQVGVLKEGWTETSQHVFLFNELWNLSRKYSDPNNTEGLLVDVYQFTYDGS